MKPQQELFDNMLDEQAKKLSEDKKNGIDVEEEIATKNTVRQTLKNFKDYIHSVRFKAKCAKKSAQTGLRYTIVRNFYVKSILEKIADILGLTLSITGDMISYAVEFVGRIINCIVDFAISICKKIIRVFTLDCGTTC